MDNEEKINYIGGQLTAMTAFLRALAVTHPDIEQLLIEFEERVQAALASTIPSNATEDYLDGLHAQADSFRLWPPKA